MIMSDAEVSMDLGSESYEQSRAVLDQGYQGVSGSIRNQDQGWGYQGSLISGSRVKSGSGQRPARGMYLAYRITLRLFFFYSACRAMPAGPRLGSAAQSAEREEER